MELNLLVVICFQICIFVLGDTPIVMGNMRYRAVVICFQICIFVLGDTPSKKTYAPAALL